MPDPEDPMADEVFIAADGTEVVFPREAKEHIMKLHMADSDYVPDQRLIDVGYLLSWYVAQHLPEPSDGELDPWEAINELVDAGEYDLAVHDALQLVDSAAIPLPPGLAAALDWWLGSDPYPQGVADEVAPIIARRRLPARTIDRAAWQADREAMYRQSMRDLGLPTDFPRPKLRIAGQSKVAREVEGVHAIYGIVATDEWIAGGEPTWREGDWF